MSGFTPEQIDFLMGGLHKVSMANVSSITLNLEDININLEDININGASTSAGAMQVQPIQRANSPYAASVFTVYGASTAGIVRSSLGTIFSLVGTNMSAGAVRYLQLHDTAAVIASGAVPRYSFQVPTAPGQTIVGSDFFTDLGDNFQLGVVYAWSTTPNSFTPATGAHHGLAIRLK